MDNNKVKDFSIGLAIGFVVGGVIALLTAPVSGKVAREEIKKNYRDFKGRFTKSKVDNTHR
jgi:gas vesicle protein